ncbi:dipeptidase [Dongia deserti]|uniref:dipeptidase n=1 Tax=Dongia deserti TaxID=2268030 RepID=UPI000E659F5B|nr:membrane dipeptidase [Dongia deserti]
MPTAIRWDAHSCLPLLSGIDMGPLRRHKKAGFDFVSINVGMDMNPIEQVMKAIAWFRHWLAQHSDEFVLVDTMADVKAAKEAGKLAVAFDLEGSKMLLEDVAMVEVYRNLGVRQAHLVYNRNNTVGGGCHDDDDKGLTAYGREVVRAVNRAGILMDCSHNGERTSLDIIETSEKPVIFSHANARALVDHQRNVTDRQIDACAATGGVIGINGIRLFLGAEDNFAEPMANHIDYMVQRVGPDHVGIGIDISFDLGVDDHPKHEDRSYWWPASGRYNRTLVGGAGPEVLPEIEQLLRQRGYDDAAIDNIFGLNFVRVAETTWR